MFSLTLNKIKQKIKEEISDTIHQVIMITVFAMGLIRIKFEKTEQKKEEEKK